MIRGLDTTFLVEAEVREHPDHAAARGTLERLLDAGDTFALAPQVTAEFVHIVTDHRRFSRPLTVAQATERAGEWWRSKEVSHALPDDEAVRLFLSWMQAYRLGRKRLLDTLLAATYHAAGIGSVVTTNARDFSLFGCFEVVVPH